MLLDHYLSYHTKLIIAIVCAGIWIYFRTAECYAMLPRYSLFATIFVMIWVYMFAYEPLVCPIGLGMMILYMYTNKNKKFKL